MSARIILVIIAAPFVLVTINRAVAAYAMFLGAGETGADAGAMVLTVGVSVGTAVCLIFREIEKQ